MVEVSRLMRGGIVAATVSEDGEREDGLDEE